MANQESTRLFTMLERLTTELELLTFKTEELQAEISPLIAEYSSSASGSATALQSLDVVSQHLAALTQFSHTISQTVPRDVRIADADFTGHVGVELLAARLNGTEPRATQVDSKSGECDFF